MKLNLKNLKDAERLIRFAMVVTLCTAGVSKLFSHGTFAEYYGGLFRAKELRIHLPGWSVDGFLLMTPFMEIGIGLGLLLTRYRGLFIHAWCLYFVALEFGHYVLEQWSSVNEMIPFILMGGFCLVLPNHAHWFSCEPETNQEC